MFLSNNRKYWWKKSKAAAAAAVAATTKPTKKRGRPQGSGNKNPTKKINTGPLSPTPNLITVIQISNNTSSSSNSCGNSSSSSSITADNNNTESYYCCYCYYYYYSCIGGDCISNNNKFVLMFLLGNQWRYKRIACKIVDVSFLSQLLESIGGGSSLKTIICNLMDNGWIKKQYSYHLLCKSMTIMYFLMWSWCQWWLNYILSCIRY